MLSSVYVKEVPDLAITLSTDWVAIGSMVVTVIIVVLAAWFQVHQAKMLAEQTKKQMEAEQDLRRRQFIAQSRREWIATLREEISNLLSKSAEYHTCIIGKYHEAWHTPQDQREKGALLEGIVLSNELLNIREKIELLLYPKPAKSELGRTKIFIEADMIIQINKLLKQLSDLKLFIEKHVDVPIDDIKPLNKEYVRLLHEVKTIGKVILKTEWERVKKLED